MDKYKFNLQLFNDGATEEDSVNEVQSEPTRIGLDENGKVGFVYDKPEPDGDEEAENDKPAAGTPGREQTEAGAVYSPEEVRTTDFEKLDPGKIPADMLPWYKSMQAGFTRKTQEVAEKSRELDAILEKARQIAKPEQKPQLSPEQYFEQRHKFLASQVTDLFGGVLDGDMQHWTPAQRLAYDRLNTQLTRMEERQEAARQDYERRSRGFADFVAAVETELRAADSAAYDYAVRLLQSGEVLEKDKRGIVQALQSGDRETVKKHFENFRKAYHADKAGVLKTAAPPRVEQPGGGRSDPKGPPDYSELARLKSFDEKLQWMRKHGIQP